MIRFVRGIEARLPKQHPIGQTGGMGASNAAIHASSADWVSPDAHAYDGRADGYRTGHYTFGSGPSDKGDRPILVDTDHLWGIGGTVSWAWKSFCRGYNVLYMDPWRDQPSGFFDIARWPDPPNTDLRREMGCIRRFAENIDLPRSAPANGLASSGYCLAVGDETLIAYQPVQEEPVSLQLGSGWWLATFHDPRTGETSEAVKLLLDRPGTWELKPDFAGGFAVLIERP
jgi:hypothetical protein